MDAGAMGSVPDVSVVIPAFGVAEWLVDSVASALGQSVSLEVIVVDDASPDDGIARLQAAFPSEPRLRIVANRRAKGVCGARNTGLEEASAPWVVFLDGDDQLLPNGLAALLAGASEGVVGVFGGFRHVDEAGQDVTSSWLVDRADAFRRYPERPLGLGVLPRRTFNPPPWSNVAQCRGSLDRRGLARGSVWLRTLRGLRNGDALGHPRADRSHRC